MAEGSIMELGVVIRAMDYFTGPLRSMVSSVTAAEGKMKSLNTTMKMMGKSTAEIDAINASLNKMADQKAFANIASDLQKAGMARQDIAAMEGSYMRMAQAQRDMAKAQEKYAAGKDLAMSGVGALTTAAVGGFGIMEMVKQAGEFQSNMATIQDSTGATNKQMQDFGNAIMNASQQVSKFNDFQMAQIGQTLTSGGFSNIKQAQNLLLPTAKFAEVQAYENKASDPIESTKQAIEMAHLFKNYDPKSFGNFLNTFNKYSMMQPGDSSQLEQTLKYLAPTALTMGMSSDDIMSLSAIANRVGLTGSHGGTNSADMILRLIPGLIGGGPTPIKNSKGKITGYKTPKAWQAMEDLGFIDKNGKSKFFDKNGKITNVDAMLSTMIADSKKMNPMQLQQKYHDIFGIQGGRAAAIFADPKTMQQMQDMRKQLSKTKNIDKIHNDHMNTDAGQLNLLKSNSMTLMLRVGQQLAKSLNPALVTINSMLDKLGKFSQAHPGVNKIIGDFLLFAVGGKAAEGVVKILAGNFKMLQGAIGMIKPSAMVGGFSKLKGVFSGIKTELNLVKIGLKMLGTGFLDGVKSAGKFVAAVGKITGKGAISAIKGIGSALKIMGSGALSVIKTLGKFGLALAKLGLQAAKWAVQMAADWLIAMGPVGWIIMGVTALITAGIIMWNTNFLGFRDKLKGIWKVVQTDAGKTWDWIKNKANDFMNFLKNLPHQALSIGKNIIDGLKNGLMGAVGGLMGAVKSIGSSISGTFKSILGIHSPSKVFMEHGKFIVQGLSMGIDKNAYVANQSTNRLANGVVNGFRPNVSNGSVSLAGGSGAINIHPGAIVIQGGNASAQEIAQMVLTKLGQATRTNLMNTGSSLNIASF